MKNTIIVVIAVVVVGSLIFVARGKKASAPVTNETKQETQAQSTVQEKTVQDSQELSSNTADEPQELSSKDQPTQANQQIQNNTPMGLDIKVTKEGTGDRKTKAGDTISVHYTGKLTDGTKFDSSLDRGAPFEFTIGQGMVIQGWEKGLLDMRVGEKRTLTIPADMGYGSRGAGGVIPPNAALIFDVELMAIK